MATESNNLTSRVGDIASIEMIEKSVCDCVDTFASRYETQKNQCGFGRSGVCCRICHMGPCRITKNAPKGICGADVDTIVARNFLREVTGGTAAHSDHARHLVLLLKKVALGQVGDYKITDEKALRYAADLYKVEQEGRAVNDVALDLANLFLSEFAAQDEGIKSFELAPIKRQNVWEAHHMKPNGVDRMVVEAMHRTTMGVDHDYKHLLMHAFSTALVDGWAGSRIGTIVSDVLFGSPSPVKSTANLGVLGENTVNILIHGHEPTLSEMLTVAVAAPDIKEYAKNAGAEGVTLAGICCTANEILMRHGVPVAGNMMQQELAIITGAVEMMVIDVQCCMPSLPEVAAKYHTEIISASEIARTIGADAVDFDEANPIESAKALVRRAIDNFKNRDPEKVAIPKVKKPLIAGFSVDAIKYMLGGKYRASFRPLNDAIMQNRIYGVVGLVGCNNPKQKADEYTNILTKELLKRNVLVLQTGCSAIASAKAGMMRPESAFDEVGTGLREVCEAIGMPPVLHMGSCVDNSRILEAATEIVLEGGLGDDLSSVPAVGVAPEWMSEKAIAIGCYFVASGVDVVLGNPFYTGGSENVNSFLHSGCKELFGASFHLHEDPYEAAEAIMDLLTKKREKLGINKKSERKLFDMNDRRAAHV